ncbi:DUF3152 domain-containing protein [Streptomyces sp. NPDC056367]|uniref:DUF3152 domain-containing protein n=1 Tax=Streptomyces sp. NPDC056367 TaxID=3345797 RepID=UPI0035E2D499
MGRHSRKAQPPAPVPDPAPAPAPASPEPQLGYEYDYEFAYGYDSGEPGARRRPEPTVTHQGYAARDARAGGHPQQYEQGGAWGAGPDPAPVYGDWRGVPRTRTAAPTALLDSDTPAFGTPAVGFPQVTLAPPAPAPAPVPSPAAMPVQAPAPAHGPVTSTGSHRKVRVPGPRTPADAAVPEAERPGSGRSRKAWTYTGMAAAAVTTALAVVVAVHMTSEADGAKPDPLAAPGKVPADAAASANSPTAHAPAADAPAVPAAPELTYEQKMAQQLPIDAKLAGPGTFDTVPGVAKAPGKGKTVRYRVDVEQGLGLDPALFAEAVHRTLNDDRSWGHGGAMTFERVPGGEADFVITLASPGTTGKWCAKSGLDTTVDNVSCDSASTERVMINAFRWAQGSPTYGPEQMLSYRQMLINHEVGHRLGHGHVNCKTPGALAPIMQQQTKSLDIDGIQCKPNPWVFPGT